MSMNGKNADRNHADTFPKSDAGTARLSVVVPIALVSFFYVAMLEYALPLYFEARTELALGGTPFPRDVWSEVIKYKMTAFAIGPILAGLLARRYGERMVWSAGLALKFPIPAVLAIHPSPNLVAVLAFWQGITATLIWIAGLSLIQMVVPSKKGFSNGLLMTSMGVGSAFGPLLGRVLLYRSELISLAQSNEWSEVWLRLLALKSLASSPQLVDFELMFWLLSAITLTAGVVLVIWGQRPGRFQREEPQSWLETLADLRFLSCNHKFWALVVALSFLGGPIFQASNQFLPYRAKEVGLIQEGGADTGWVWLNLLKNMAWIPGGVAVGLLAGRRAGGMVPAAIVGAFGISAFLIGQSAVGWQLFVGVAAFEFVRQCMRWSHGGYMSEHMPSNVRSTAIGYTITLGGLAATAYVWIAPRIWDPNSPDFNSSGAFLCVSILGLVGCVGLFLYDRVFPIRDVSVPKQ